ncbi:hypothetical protein CKO11_11840 [Rhodobacter sp. TJ_12]|uniref:hypothetical protein n=1 Tax=Rhodobacter sp. TJ_12 TaxID=2029399 RepID=UPI001CC0D747|nr:hypothetical protein [Rhodobacter sp. TJ_12]MBZ4023150.1 hypothetical protein [Rhodobacter sp. TJ_12]
MSKSPRLLIADPPQLLRQRQRADGSWRIWWEPSNPARRLGFDVVELDANRLTWSVREAGRLNRELAAALKTGRRAAAAPMGRTIDGLIVAYTSSAKFARLAPKTQDSYRKAFAPIAQKWGAYAVIDFSKPVMHEWHETLLATKSTATASARIRHMSILMAHAELIGWRPENSNPCTRLGMATPKGRRQTASWSDFDALIEAAQILDMPGMVTAMTLGLYTGQRQTDLRLATLGEFQRRPLQLMGWAEPRPCWIWALTRQKRGNQGTVVIHDDAAPALEAAIAQARARTAAANAGHASADALAAAALVWDDRTGQPFTGAGAEDRFQNRWGAIRRAAAAALQAKGQGDAATAIAQLQFRDLRRTFGALSRAGGASKDDTADVLGNSAATDQHLADIYMSPQIETSGRAVTALRRPTKPERKKA